MPVNEAPEGGRLHVLRVLVSPGREWQEAIDAAGPDTLKSYDVRKVGDKYPPQPGDPREREIILVNFGKTIPDSQYALNWAKPHGLRPANPRQTFAVGEHKPELHRELKADPMVVVSLDDCIFGSERRVCRVWWGDAKRCAGLLSWFDVGWAADYVWFAFVRE
ncbi:MAG TPA: hypothetical protein VGZ92_12550 [Bradyrhizobium sp.]|jgi:hypothetical protein|nr:hypothetical protein [Bradyrhizobium sp.]